jgi:hypothetical protein
MKRSSSAVDATPDMPSKRLPDVADVADRVTVLSEISMSVEEILFDGKPAIRKAIHREFLDLYMLGDESVYLPKVLWHNNQYVIMEKLVHFEFKEEKIKDYYDGIKEVFLLAKSLNADQRCGFDMSPPNTMMRENGDIVFIDLWTRGRTRFYNREATLLGVGTSLTLILMYYCYQTRIPEYITMLQANMLKLTGTVAGATDGCDVPDMLMNDQDLNLFKASELHRHLLRVTMLHDWLKDHRAGKKVHEMTWTLSGFTDFDYKNYYDSIRYQHVRIFTFANDFFKSLEINDDLSFFFLKYI